MIIGYLINNFPTSHGRLPIVFPFERSTLHRYPGSSIYRYYLGSDFVEISNYDKKDYYKVLNQKEWN